MKNYENNGAEEIVLVTPTPVPYIYMAGTSKAVRIRWWRKWVGNNIRICTHSAPTGKIWNPSYCNLEPVQFYYITMSL